MLARDIATICILGVSVIVGLSGNLLIVIVRVYKQLQRRKTTAYAFLVCQLAIADTIFAFTLIFNLKTKLHNDIWTFGKGLCKSVNVLQSVSLSTTVLFLTVMSYERYLGISKPLTHRWSIKKALVIVIVIWLYIFLTFIPYLMALSTDIAGLCYDYDYISPGFRKGYSVFLVITNFALPLIIITIFHTLIIRKMKKHFKRIKGSKFKKGEELSITTGTVSFPANRRQKKCWSQLFCKYFILSSREKEIETLLDENSNLAVPSSGNDECSNKLSKRKRPKRKKDRKLVKTLVTVTLCFVIMTLPLQIYFILLDFYVKVPNGTHIRVAEVFASFVYLHCCVNCIIYSVLDKRFRKDVRATFQAIKHCEIDRENKLRRSLIKLRVVQRFSKESRTSSSRSSSKFSSKSSSSNSRGSTTKRTEKTMKNKPAVFLVVERETVL